MTKNDSLVKENSKMNKRLSALESNTDADSEQHVSGNTTNNVQNIIKIRAFGKEDLSDINKKDMLRIMNRCYSAIQEMVRLVHFNKDVPQNHNVYISNMRSPHAIIYRDNNWEIEDVGVVVDHLHEIKMGLLHEKYYDYKKNNDPGLTPAIRKKMDRLIATYDRPDIKTTSKRGIKKLAFNKRNIPEATRKLT